jgi:hypothetical protein
MHLQGIYRLSGDAAYLHDVNKSSDVSNANILVNVYCSTKAEPTCRSGHEKNLMLPSSPHQFTPITDSPLLMHQNIDHSHLPAHLCDRNAGHRAGYSQLH